jgi:hypothetical protein
MFEHLTLAAGCPGEAGCFFPARLRAWPEIGLLLNAAARGSLNGALVDAGPGRPSGKEVRLDASGQSPALLHLSPEELARARFCVPPQQPL